MKRCLLPVLLFCIFLYGCASKLSQVPTQTDTPNQLRISTTATDNQMPTPSKISTTANTKTPSLTLPPTAIATITVTATPMQTYTPTLFPSPIPGTSQQCIEILKSGIPTDLALTGTMVLIGIPQRIAGSYFLDMETGEQTVLPDESMQVFNNGSVSPDRKWFAYVGTDDTRNLVLVNSMGVLEKKIDLATIIAPVTYAGLVDWLDNERLILRWFAGEYGSPEDTIIVILNPFTGEWEVYQPNYSNLYSRYPDFLYKWGHYSPTLSVYNPDFDRAVYLTPEGVVLWNLILEQQIKLFEDETIYNVSRPVWSPNGERFILDLNSPSGRNLFLVSKDGMEQQVTFFSGNNGFGTNMGDYSDFTWSPDGHSIAFWLMTGRDLNTGYNSYDLAVLDLSTKQVRNFCIPAYICLGNYPVWYPVWSPDGTKLLVAVPNGVCPSGNSPQRSKTVLVDLSQNQAYTIAEDVVPLGWMISE